MYYCAQKAAATKKQQSAIVSARTIFADFTIDRPALLEINHKMGGGDCHCVEKLASLCSASVCFLGVLMLRKVRYPSPKINIGGKS
jgi:hypothetical protein